MNKNLVCLTLLILLLPLAAHATCDVCFDGGSGAPYCDESGWPVGSCFCTVHSPSLGTTWCVESGGSCVTGWLCGTAPGHPVPQPNVLPIPPNGHKALATVWPDLMAQDGYALIDRHGVLRVTDRGIIYVSVLMPDGGIEDFAAAPDRVGFIEIAASSACPRPAMADGSFGQRLYLRCAYGVAIPTPRRMIRTLRFRAW